MTLQHRAAGNSKILALIHILRHGGLEALATFETAAIQRLRSSDAEEGAWLDGERGGRQVRCGVGAVLLTVRLLSTVGLLSITLLPIALLRILAVVWRTLLWRTIALRRILAGVLHRVLVGWCTGLGVVSLRLIFLRLLRNLATLRIGRRTGLAPLSAGTGLRLILRFVGGLLLIWIGGLRLLDRLLAVLRLVRVSRVLGIGLVVARAAAGNGHV